MFAYPPFSDQPPAYHSYPFFPPATYHPVDYSPPPPGFLQAYDHHSHTIRIHSYSPAYLRAQQSPSILSVHCTLLLDNPTNQPSAHQPKVIRLCFAHLPLATHVARAPIPSAAHPLSTIGNQDLTLSSKIPDAREILKDGQLGGRLGLYCEILEGGQEDEVVLERIWFGDFDYLEGLDNKIEVISAPPFQTTFPESRSHLSPPQPHPHLRTRHSWSAAPAPKATMEAERYKYQGGIDPVVVSANNGVDIDYFNVSINSDRLSGGEHYSYSGDLQSTYYSPSPSPNEPILAPASYPPAPSPSEPQPTRYNIHPTHQAPAQTTFYRPVPSSSGSSKYNAPIGALPVNFRTVRANSKDKDKPLNHGLGVHSAASGGGKKAALEIHGNLNSMAIGWTDEEWKSRRRLVQFWRKVEGQIIHATFSPITQASYVENSIVISCLWREQTNECYVTSVDAIFLLEALIGGRFSVEEKNRIRRNLERCKPETMSKAKPDTEEFFKIIMGFPKPKPRNIEKDVKVFKWGDFQGALKKSISKYFINETPSGPTASTPPAAPSVFADRVNSLPN